MIFLVKGHIKSTLVNIKEGEIRAINNTDLNDYQEDKGLTEWQDKYEGFFEIELLDIVLNPVLPIDSLGEALKQFSAVRNYRLIATSEDITLEYLQQVIVYIDKRLKHLGGVVLSSNEPILEHLHKTHPATERILLDPEENDNEFYKPYIHPSWFVINNSYKNNAYHFGRVTLECHENHIEMIDHQQYNIPKEEIEVCKDCEFRRVCFDKRIPQKTGNSYQYSKTCDYDPYTGVWRT